MTTVVSLFSGVKQQEQQEAATNDPSDDDDVSLFYALLPHLVRRSMPKVRSLRRSFNSYRRTRTSSTESTESGSRTPPPAYHEALTPLTAALFEDDTEYVESPSTDLSRDTTFSQNEGSGIQWKYASQGLNLLTLSAHESSSTSSDASFSRQLYIDATSYLLRGLPTQMTAEELTRLGAATPPSLIQGSDQAYSSDSDKQQTTLPRSSSSYSSSPQPTKRTTPPTLLHCLISTITQTTLLILALLWPYLHLLARKAYTYERHHHISERLATRTWSMASAIGKQTFETANFVCLWNDGCVGQMVEAVFLWGVQGVAGGFCEGVGEGMGIGLDVEGWSSESSSSSAPTARRRNATGGRGWQR